MRMIVRYGERTVCHRGSGKGRGADSRARSGSTSTTTSIRTPGVPASAAPLDAAGGDGSVSTTRAFTAERYFPDASLTRRSAPLAAGP